MRTTADGYLSQLNKSRQVRGGFLQTQRLLSLLVIFVVFWGLKLTGISMAGEAFCGKEEHVHTETCGTRELVCTLEESAGHVHTEECLQKVLSCTQEEQEATLQTEVHTESLLTCTLQETQGHSHGVACYQPTLVCTLSEEDGHVHTDDCYAGTLTCVLEECEGHVHEAACYVQQTDTLSEEEAPQAHVHTDACYVIEEGNYVCGLEETEGHSHGEACYEILENCPLEEHTHTPNCYSDISADLETSADWEESLAELIHSSNSRDNVVLVARSQLGERESTLNFQVDEFGVRRGITRYGQWYGNPYGDWSTMFTCFCLHYAEIPEAPYNGGADALLREWEAAGMYISVTDGVPVEGNILFLDKNGNGTADATAIISSVENGMLVVVEGDLPENEVVTPDELRTVLAAEATGLMQEETLLPQESVETTSEDDSVEEKTPAHLVAETAYRLTDPRIIGYGMVPVRLPVLMRAASPLAAGDVIAKTISYDTSIFNDTTRQFVVYTQSGSNYYAFDGNGNAVPIYIDASGNITSNISDPDLILWTFASQEKNDYLIQNISTGKYMHAYPNNGSGVTTSGAYSSTLIDSGNGVKIRSNNEYARLDVSSGSFTMTQNQDIAAVYQFGYVSRTAIWLDGTNGGLMSLSGSPNQSYFVEVGSSFTLPSRWDSPSKYSYRLRGWYDVTNSRYYPAGAEVTVTGNMVFYADWAASTYDVGQFNAQTSDTVSTNDFITTHVFDYNTLFNMMSERVTVTANSSGHSETWSLVQSGGVPYQGQETLNFIFRDWDSGSSDISYPGNLNTANDNQSEVTSGIYYNELGNILFSTDNAFHPETGEGIIGKTYLGTADYLFQLNTDPSSEHYGYYYYDSKLNAASYNQSDGRFYVYDYLERTSDSKKDGGDGEFSDFLPFNSPYTNTNGKNVDTYTYAGENGEYVGTTHYMYDAKYDGQGSSSGNVGTNYWFSMSIDISFYLPNTPGTGGNKDFYGNDMHFKFSGDDDVWVLLDGKLVLDIGGVHGIENGDINFTTGAVTVNGVQVGTLSGVGEGEHTLTVYYLERGSSQSNCAIYFNLAPRYGFQIQKEDVLTQHVLNGAQFSVYTDLACTHPAELWNSKAAHDAGESWTNVFTVNNGAANMWGMSAGKTYYIKETRPPDAEGYDLPDGIIELKFDMQGFITYKVHVIEDEGNLTPGFTVHGIKVDEENQSAYIIATNAPDWVEDSTTVKVSKAWDDSKDHSSDSVTVYLTVTDPDGTVRRIREVTLSELINWTYTWENLPKYAEDGVTEIQYGVEETFINGYSPNIERIDTEVSYTSQWQNATTFESEKTYLLKTSSDCLSAVSGSATNLQWVNEETAKNSSLAKWTAAVSGNTVKFTNGNGQILTFNYGNNSNNQYFSVTTSSANYQSFTSEPSGSGFKFYATRNSRNYYMTSTISNSRLGSSTSRSSGAVFTPMVLVETKVETPVNNWVYKVTNEPISTTNQTSLTVEKLWDLGHYSSDSSLYEQLQVTVKLLANGTDTGRTVTLNLKNNWQETFYGLPKYDDSGSLISYTVEERWNTEDWIPRYGAVVANTDGSYSTTVTNAYRWGMGGPELPSTGTAARLMYILCGGSIMLTSLVYGIVLRRKRERRMK